MDGKVFQDDADAKKRTGLQQKLSENRTLPTEGLCRPKRAQGHELAARRERGGRHIFLCALWMFSPSGPMLLRIVGMLSALEQKTDSATLS